MLEKMVPIPPEFYDDHKDEDLITGKGTIFPFAVFLYFMQWAAFLGFILFYWYHPSSQVTQSKMENNYDYGKASGWNCTPLLNDPFYKSRMNYETCKTLMVDPKVDDIKSLKINIDPDCIETDDNQCENATAFRFMPFKGQEGLTGRRGVVQPGSIIDNSFDSTNSDAIKAELKKIFEPLAGLTRCSAFGMHWKNKGGWGVSRVNKLASFDIFVDQMKQKAAAPPSGSGDSGSGDSGSGGSGSSDTVCCGEGADDLNPPTPRCTGTAAGGAGGEAPRFDAAAGEFDCGGNTDYNLYICATDSRCGAAGRCGCVPSGRRRRLQQDQCNAYCTPYMIDSGTCLPYPCETEVGADPTACPTCQDFTINADGTYDFGAATAPSGQMYGPGGVLIDTSSLADYAWFEEGAEYEPCSITKEETVTMYKKYLATHDPCAWAQHNSPYMCTKTGPPAPSAVFSLAYANALLAYSIFSAVCVQIFFASSKKKKAAAEDAEDAATETPATQPDVQIQYADGTRMTPTVHPAPGKPKVGP